MWRWDGAKAQLRYIYIFTFCFIFRSCFEYTTRPSRLFTIWILFLTSDTSHFPKVLSHVRFCLSLRCSPFTVGLLLPFISCLQRRAHRCPSPRYFSQWKMGMKREHPALFSSFFPPWGVFVVRSVAELPPTRPTHHPCGLPSDLWSEGGTENFKLFSSCKCSAAS